MDPVVNPQVTGPQHWQQTLPPHHPWVEQLPCCHRSISGLLWVQIYHHIQCRVVEGRGLRQLEGGPWECFASWIERRLSSLTLESMSRSWGWSMPLGRSWGWSWYAGVTSTLSLPRLGLQQLLQDLCTVPELSAAISLSLVPQILGTSSSCGEFVFSAVLPWPPLVVTTGVWGDSRFVLYFYYIYLLPSQKSHHSALFPVVDVRSQASCCTILLQFAISWTWIVPECVDGVIGMHCYFTVDSLAVGSFRSCWRRWPKLPSFLSVCASYYIIARQNFKHCNNKIIIMHFI